MKRVVKEGGSLESISNRLREMQGAVSGTLVLCVIAFAVVSSVGGVLNGSLYARVAEYCGIARELSTLTTCVLYLALFFVATRKPSLLDRRLLTVTALGCAVTAMLVLEFALMLGHGPASVVGFVFSSTASAWGTILLVCALGSLRSPMAALMGVMLGAALGEVARVLHPEVPYEVGIVEVTACYALVIVLMYRPAGKKLDGIACGSAPASLELANPESFLGPSHALFLCALLFNVATGYGLTLNEVAHAPASVDVSALVLVGVAAYMLLAGGKGKEDARFSFAVLLVVAGFIVAPFTFVTGASSANALLRIGVRCFDMLVWLVVLAVGRRNAFALLPTFALVRSMAALGTDVGAVAGHTTNDIVGTNSDAAMLIAEVVLFAFVAFLWLGFRKFSFTDTIQGVVGVSAPTTADVPERAHGDGAASAAVANAPMLDANPSEGAAMPPASPSIEERCFALGTARGLTERETEIFAMLARGRNGQFVMDHYVVSRNTVKSHVKHIYAKLDVHSQQELIDLVERTGNA